MTIEKELFYKKRLVISLDRIDELDTILRKYCHTIRYKATTANGSSLIFKDKIELQKYDNFKNGKIVHLNIMCRSEDYLTSIEIDLAPKYHLKKETARCKYTFTDYDQERLFVGAWEEFLKKITEYQISYRICLICSFILVTAFCVFLPIRFINTKYGALTLFPIIIYLLFEFTTIMYKSDTLWDKIFPPAVFPWGEEEHKYNKLITLRSNLFWAVVIPTIVSIVLETLSIVKMLGD